MMSVMSHFSRLFTLWWTTSLTDGLHDNGTPVHLAPVGGDVNTGLLTNSISPLILKGLHS